MFESDSSSIATKIRTLVVNPNKVATSIENIDEKIDVYQAATNKTFYLTEETRKNGLT